MDISLAVLADYANISREGKLNIMGIFDVINASSFPTIHPQMQLVVRIEADALEARSQRRLQVVFEDEDGRQIFEIGGPLQLPPGQPGQTIRVNDRLLTIIGVEAPRPFTRNHRQEKESNHQSHREAQPGSKG